jgi:hypothetical protein
VIYCVRRLGLPVQLVAHFVVAADTNRPAPCLVLKVMSILILTGIFQLVIRLLCFGTSKKSLLLTGLCSSNGVNLLLNPFISLNTQINDKFNYIISALAKVIQTVYRPSIAIRYIRQSLSI